MRPSVLFALLKWEFLVTDGLRSECFYVPPLRSYSLQRTAPPSHHPRYEDSEACLEPAYRKVTTGQLNGKEIPVWQISFVKTYSLPSTKEVWLVFCNRSIYGSVVRNHDFEKQILSGFLGQSDSVRFEFSIRPKTTFFAISHYISFLILKWLIYIECTTTTMN